MIKKFWGLLVNVCFAAYFFIPKIYATVTQKSVGRLVPQEDMDAEGYGEFLNLVE